MPFVRAPRFPKVFCETQCFACAGTGCSGMWAGGAAYVGAAYVKERTASGETIICRFCDGSGTEFTYIREPVGIGEEHYQVEAPTDWGDDDDE